MHPGAVVAGLICLATALAGCGGSGQTTTTATTHTAPPRSRTVTTTKTQTVTTAAATVSSSDGVPYCSPKDLGIHYVGGQGAAGTWITTFAFVNVTLHACRLHGYPGVAMFTAGGRRIPIPVERQSSERGREVRVKPRGRVKFALGTGDGAVGPCYHAAIFRFIPPNDYAYEQIAYRRMVCGNAAFVTAVGSRY